MKKLIFGMLALISVSAATAQTQPAIASVAKFNTETYDFGKIKQNVPATATFVVTNLGSTPLIIEQANPTCGCTIADYTKSPIAPGQTGTIKATYNAAAAGAIHKAITVKFAGINELKSLNLAGEVVATEATVTAQPQSQEIVTATPVQKVKTVQVDQRGNTVKQKAKKNGKKKQKVTPAAVPQ
ncbi:hypothetical protein BH09BAC2_BH09BAC2_22550 [soil metagenome]